MTCIAPTLNDISMGLRPLYMVDQAWRVIWQWDPAIAYVALLKQKLEKNTHSDIIM